MKFNKFETVVLANEWHTLARERGFYTGEKTDDVLFALIMSELAEALEALRNRDRLESGTVPECTKDNKNAYEFELADTYIRLLDAFGYMVRKGAADVDAFMPVTDESLEKTREVIAGVHNGMTDVQKLAQLTRDVATCLYSLPTEQALVTSIIAMSVFADLIGIDLLALSKAKQAYNVNRPYKHGNKLV